MRIGRTPQRRHHPIKTMNNDIRPLIFDPEHYPEDREAEGDCPAAPCSRSKIPRHLLELRIRSAIADKEMVTAMANRDLQCGDGWRCDYAEWHREISKEIEELFILSANVPTHPPDGRK